MDNEKSLLEKLTETMKDAAHLVTEGAMAIAHPTSGTPMDMPLNKSGYALTHPHFTQTPAAEKVVKKPTKKTKKKTARTSLKKAAKKSPAKKSRKAAKKIARKGTKILGRKKRANKAKR